eukprot:730822-Prorocentrum_minimum.AAC.1
MLLLFCFADQEHAKGLEAEVAMVRKQRLEAEASVDEARREQQTTIRELEMQLAKAQKDIAQLPLAEVPVPIRLK